MRKKAQNVRAFLIYSDANKLFLKLSLVGFIIKQLFPSVSVPSEKYPPQVRKSLPLRGIIV